MYKIQVEPIKNMFGKKTGEFKACFGSFSERGNTKEEACNNLNAALDWYFLENDFVTKIKQSKDRVFFMERNFYGFSLSFVWIGTKSSYASGTLIGRVSEYNAEKYFENYFNQLVECSECDQFLEVA